MASYQAQAASATFQAASAHPGVASAISSAVQSAATSLSSADTEAAAEMPTGSWQEFADCQKVRGTFSCILLAPKMDSGGVTRQLMLDASVGERTDGLQQHGHPCWFQRDVFQAVLSDHHDACDGSLSVRELPTAPPTPLLLSNCPTSTDSASTPLQFLLIGCLHAVTQPEQYDCM